MRKFIIDEERNLLENQNYNEVIDFIMTNKRNPSKYVPEEKAMVNWQKQRRKLINAGLLKPERVGMFEKLQELVESIEKPAPINGETLHFLTNLINLSNFMH